MHDLVLQLEDALLCELGPGVGLLQLGGQALDLLLVVALPLVGLLLGHLGTQKIEMKPTNAGLQA